MRKIGIDLQRRMLEQLRGGWTRGGDGHDLIVFAMNVPGQGCLSS